MRRKEKEREEEEKKKRGLLGALFGGRLEQLPAEQTFELEVTPTAIINIESRRF